MASKSVRAHILKKQTTNFMHRSMWESCATLFTKKLNEDLKNKNEFQFLKKARKHFKALHFIGRDKDSLNRSLIA